MPIDCENPLFSQKQLGTVNQSVETAEELVSNYYKLSGSQMRHLNYDIKTASHLVPHEITDVHFAQIVRYKVQKKDTLLETEADDFYKICIQDPVIIKALEQMPSLRLYPFVLYVVCHELIHVVRFRHFLQHFHATPQQRQTEEAKVHHLTHRILENATIAHVGPVFQFYEKWHQAFYDMQASDAGH
ncbi:MAG: hypothetical protein ACQERN_01300 [Thermodesulfobacteriota bacterium]